MAAFSSSFQQHHPFLLIDSLHHLPNSPICALFDQPINSTTTTTTNTHPFSAPTTNNGANCDLLSVTKYRINSNSMDNSSSTVTDMGKKRKCKEGSSANNHSAQSKDKREEKGKKPRKMKKDNGEEKKKSKQEKKAAEEEVAPKGYIHVRARRGQATDSHSLAERIRRERISERMKLLQAIVPGCDKVSGKALMLDEVINYVQSLQNQVEFLSMKLASVNPMLYDFGMDLESFMVSPDQDLSVLPSPMPSMQDCSPTMSHNNYNPLQENSANSTGFPNVPPQGSTRQTLWEMDDFRQKITNQSGFSNSFFSFH